MIIKKAEFIKSAAARDGFIVSDLPEIVIAGKSNVGKSSFINFVVNNSKLARTSTTPGRTRLINYFLINEEFFIVDLPGYGYAKGSKAEIEAWGQLMEQYFKTSTKIKKVIMLVDVRHAPTKEDRQFTEYLYYYRIPFSVIATKSDKISKNEVNKNLQMIATELKIGIGDIFAVSSDKKIGKEKVFDLLESSLNVK